MGEDSPAKDVDARRSGDGDAAVDELLGLLSDRYMRHVLVYIGATEQATVAELADVLVGIDAMETDDVATPDDRERVLVRLHHITLPKLEAAGYVAVDGSTVTRDELPPAVCTLLQSPD